ncbi:MAG: LON peptidase substrate-binding domain-containing protein [Myxococcota bacterium]
MASSPFPARFPIFPLKNVVLFPDTVLPLRMFEPRYRAMTSDALRGNRVIGMTLLRSGDSAPEAGPAHVFELGCAGVITSQRPQSDGTHWILLEGKRRFRLLRQEPTERGYIRASVELLEEETFDELGETTRAELSDARPELEEKLLEYARLGVRRRVEQLRERMSELDPVALVNSIAFGIDCSLVEKQSLLEAADPLERARLLLQLLDFQVAAARLPQPHDTIN